MDKDLVFLISFLAVKPLLFSGYIYYGFRRFREDGVGFIVYSLTLGIVRSCLGVVFAFGAFWLATLIAVGVDYRPFDLPGIFDIVNKFILTFLCLLPGRLLLWVLLSRLIAGRVAGKPFLWALGGVALSLPFDLLLCFEKKFIGPFIFVG